MLCKFCQENVRGTPCQSASQSAKCPNNRDNDWPDDDYATITISCESKLPKEEKVKE